MSLGFVDAERRRESRAQSGRAQIENETPESVAPSTRVIRCKSLSYRSSIACASCFSCGAVISCFSALSVLSFASVLSVFSIGSTLSVLSVASVNSRMSLASNGCVLKMFADCSNRKPDDGMEFDVSIDPDTWDFMATCDFNDYQRFKTYEPASAVSPCDYQPAQCAYRGRNGFVSHRECNVRRKGFSTWRSMGDRPSFKIKFEKDTNGSKDFDFGDVGRQQQFKADKVTINNMGYSDSWNGYDEVDAYDTFYRLQGSRTPIAARIKTRAIRGSYVQWESVHALVEDVSNDDYFKRIHADDLLLYEADNRGTEIKDVEGVWNDATIDGARIKDLVNRPSDLHEFMTPQDILGYYVAEKLTHNWDGGLLTSNPKNFYLLAEGNTTNPRISYVPKGLDFVFQGCIYVLFTDGGRPFDGPTQYAIQTYPDVLAQRERDVATNVPYQSMTCGQEIGIGFLMFVLSAALAGLALVCALLFGRARRVLRCARFPEIDGTRGAPPGQ